MDHITAFKDQTVTHPSYFVTNFLQPVAVFITKDFLKDMIHNYMLRLGLLSEGWGMARIFDYTSAYEWILLVFAVYSLASRFRPFSPRAIGHWLAQFLFTTFCFGLLLSVSATREAIIPNCGWRHGYLGFGPARYKCIAEKLACHVSPQLGLSNNKLELSRGLLCSGQQLLSFYSAAALRVFILQGRFGIWYFVIVETYKVSKSILSGGDSAAWRTLMRTFRMLMHANTNGHAVKHEGELADHPAAPH